MSVSRNCQNFLRPIISGTGKATNLKFCTHILSIDRNKSPLTVSATKVRGREHTQRLENSGKAESCHCVKYKADFMSVFTIPLHSFSFWGDCQFFGGIPYYLRNR